MLRKSFQVEGSIKISNFGIAVHTRDGRKMMLDSALLDCFDASALSAVNSGFLPGVYMISIEKVVDKAALAPELA